MIDLACWDFFLKNLSCLSANLEEVLDLGWQVQRKDREVLSIELLNLLTLESKLGLESKEGHKGR